MAIGSTLRDARHRLGLDLPECESATRIRGRYLAALEDERFELLPEPTYARGFLRQYAQYLELDPAPLLAELEASIGSGDQGEAASGDALRRTSVPPPARDRRRRRVRPALLLVGGIAAVVGAIYLGGRDDPETPGFAGNPATTTSVARTTTPPPQITTTRATPAPAAPATPVRLQLAGRPPDGSWVQVRRGGATGPVLFEGTIGQGATRTFALTRGVWVRVGWGPGLEASIDGERQALPDGTGDVVFSDGGRRG